MNEKLKGKAKRLISGRLADVYVKLVKNIVLGMLLNIISREVLGIDLVDFSA